jgi:hypothetical protein
VLWFIQGSVYTGFTVYNPSFAKSMKTANDYNWLDFNNNSDEF